MMTAVYTGTTDTGNIVEKVRKEVRVDVAQPWNQYKRQNSVEECHLVWFCLEASGQQRVTGILEEAEEFKAGTE